jgi:sporulation protein YlmC with PRC-barrel domain
MRKLSIFLSTFILLALLLTACGGEETSTSVPSTEVPPITAEVTSTTEAVMTETPAGTDMTTTPAVPVTGGNNPSRVSNLMDFTVVDQNGDQVGDVDDLVLDFDNVNISYVVITTGGSLDLGDKKVFIPWDQLQLDSTQEGTFTLLADTEMLKNAPDVDLTSALPAMGEPAADWDADIRSFWESGASSGTGTTMTDTPSANTPAVEATNTSTTTTEMTATPTSSAASSSGTGQGASGFDKLQGVMLASDVIGATVEISPQGNEPGSGQAAATATPGGSALATATPGGSALATSTPGGTTLATNTPSAEATATTTTGTGNSGSNGSDLNNIQATVSDVIVDSTSGEILFLVINGASTDVERLIPVPIGFLQWDPTNEAFVIKISGNALQNAPAFTQDQFPDTSSSGWDTEFNDFWQNQGTGSGAGVGTVTAATATPTP